MTHSSNEILAEVKAQMQQFDLFDHQVGASSEVGSKR